MPPIGQLFNALENICQLFEAEMRCAIIEAETREEVMHEMEGHMRSMEAMHSRRLMTEVSRLLHHYARVQLLTPFSWNNMSSRLMRRSICSTNQVYLEVPLNVHLWPFLIFWKMSRRKKMSKKA